jgi:hypothetical protein
MYQLVEDLERDDTQEFTSQRELIPEQGKKYQPSAARQMASFPC